MINKKRLIKLTQSLVRINSENPSGNERELARWVRVYLSKLNLRPRIYEFRPKRANILLTIPGKRHDKSLLISPHLDTVPAGDSWKEDPFAARIRGGRIYGLGATDCKGNLACALETINSLAEDRIKLDYDLVFAATANEESGSEFGLISLLDKGILKPTEAVILDADDFEIVVTQKGLMHLKVLIKGRKAHGAYPWLGINAIDAAVRTLARIKDLKFRYRPSKYLHPPTINIGTIKGGDKVNVVAHHCEFELDLRFLPGMPAGSILAKVRGVCKKYAGEHEIEIEGIQQPYAIDESHRLVTTLKAAAERSGVNAPVRGSEGATVITFFQDKKIPAIATGFGSEGQAHMADEYVKAANLCKGAEILERFLKDYKFS